MQLAVEIWQGAEYMCLDHEEATIKNIFLSNFLERLRDAGRVTMARPQVAEVARIESASPPPVAPHIPPVNIQVPNSPTFPEAETIPAIEALEKVASIPEPAATNDEYLGIVSSTENRDEVAIETHSYSNECVPESELEIIEQAGDLLADVDGASEVETVDAVNHSETKILAIVTATLPPSTPVEIVTTPTVRVKNRSPQLWSASAFGKRNARSYTSLEREFMSPCETSACIFSAIIVSTG